MEEVKELQGIEREQKQGLLLTLSEVLCSSMLDKDGNATTPWTIEQAQTIKSKIIEIVKTL